jgi:uncharacterized protein
MNCGNKNSRQNQENWQDKDNSPAAGKQKAAAARERGMEVSRATVFMIDMRAGIDNSMLDKFGSLLEAAEISKVLKKGGLTAIKIHFGEAGCTANIRPVYTRVVVDAIRKAGGKPFLTDTNSLYRGARMDAPSHLATAVANGYAEIVTGAPIIIADGLRGRTDTLVTCESSLYLKECHVAREIAEADSVIVMSHFKCHELTGIGGSLKNVGMGCASRAGKLAMHSNVSPTIGKKCVGCGRCVEECPVAAIKLEKQASIDASKCIGCAKCIVVCPTGAIHIEWGVAAKDVRMRMIDQVAATTKGGKDRFFYLNFVLDVSPKCDCYGHSDAPVVQDVGILASSDPVAIDLASADLVNAQPPARGSVLEGVTCKDIFAAVHPEIEWRDQLEYASTLGLGSLEYDLVKLG